jgi:hypothetical protein
LVKGLEVSCSLVAPAGRNPCIISVWIIEPPDPDPRPLVTIQHLNRVRSYVELGVDEADSNWPTTVVHEFPLHRLE